MKPKPMMTDMPRASAVVLLASALLAGCSREEPATVDAAPAATPPTAEVVATPQPAADLTALCQADAVQAIAAKLATGVTVKEIANGPKFNGGAKYFAATDKVPAFCQVTGSFVTNAETGKTANFLATFPANWNGKYLQMGCSGHCGQFAVSDPAQITVTITNQGYPFQSIIKGYATFATDEGHQGYSGGTWAVKANGEVDQEAIDDFFYRASQTLSVMGKEFTKGFYSAVTSKPQDIAYSYFNGCSGGGRDAFVAAGQFPEQFDGIIAGSAYNPAGAAFQMAAVPLATLRSADAQLPPELVATIDPIVKAQCDEADGVKDGLIQNPAACDFRPDRDLPKCGDDGAVAGQCFTQAQIDTVSVLLTAVTDEQGRVVQPGFSVSEIQAASFLTPQRPADLAAVEPFPGSDTGSPMNGYWPLADAYIKVFVHKNAADFHTRSIFSFEQGGDGQVTGLRAVVPSAEVELLRSTTRMATGQVPELMDKLIKQNRKLLVWHNLSDQTLTPYMSINFYKELAKQQGGYAKLQDNVRLFSLPGTGHCSMMGVGPTSFDAITALEQWVEQGKAPNALTASLYPIIPPGIPDVSKPATRTMPLCKFPEMARYKDQGDINEAANWHCPEGDEGMLQVGESGRQAGVTL